jgi:hypothetical protein
LETPGVRPELLIRSLEVPGRVFYISLNQIFLITGISVFITIKSCVRTVPDQSVLRAAFLSPTSTDRVQGHVESSKK